MEERIKKEIIKELKNIWFWGYVIIMIVLAGLLQFSLKNNFPKTFMVLILILFPINQFVYNIKVKIENKFQNRLRWGYFSILSLLAVIYLSTVLGEIQISAILIVFLMGGILCAIATIQLTNLLKSRGKILLIIHYLFFAFILILLFGFIYTVTNALGQNILNQENEKIQGTGEIIYFSLSVFYSNVIEYYPVGFSKWIMQIEMIISYIIHIIILGYLISEIKKKDNNSLSNS